MDQLYGICRVAVSPLRAEPSDKAEIASQLLFGEGVQILKKTECWWYVKTAYDNYEGWLDFKQLELVDLDAFNTAESCRDLVPANPLNVLLDANGTPYYLSPGSHLPAFKDGICFLGKKPFKVEFTPVRFGFVGTDQLIETALFFKNAPYLWGGRSFFGIDCSGFAQIVFKLNGIRLRRDASQQAEEGATVDFLPEAQAGDLAFFDNQEGRIVHVGIMLSPSEIIHASGKVKIDPIDGQGIFSNELNRYTHKLRIIKRFI